MRDRGLQSNLVNLKSLGLEGFFFFLVGGGGGGGVVWPCSLAITSTGQVGLCVFLWFYVQEHPKAQPAVVLVLKRFRRWGNSLNSHLTDWEKPGIEPATPGLQDIGLSPTPQRLHWTKGFISNYQ